MAGARAEEPELHDIESTAGRDEVPEMAHDAATFPFARLVRRLAGVLADEGRAASAAGADLPTFTDGARLLALADAVDGAQPTAG